MHKFVKMEDFCHHLARDTRQLRAVYIKSPLGLVTELRYILSSIYGFRPSVEPLGGIFSWCGKPASSRLHHPKCRLAEYSVRQLTASKTPRSDESQPPNYPRAASRRHRCLSKFMSCSRRRGTVAVAVYNDPLVGDAFDRGSGLLLCR